MLRRILRRRLPRRARAGGRSPATPASNTPYAAALAAILAIGPLPVAAQSAPADDTATLNATLQRARDAFSAAYVDGEFARMAAMYTEDAILLPSIGTVLGREAIERYFTYGAGRTQVAHSMMPRTLRVDGNTAVETGEWSSTVRRGDGPAVTASGRHILVWKRQEDGRWLISHDVWHQPPSSRPEPSMVAEGIVSAPDRNETWPAIDPADGSLWFSVYENDFNAQRLFRAPRDGDGWTTPAPVPFSDGTHGDRAPRFSADGARLYFTSNRPVPGRPEGDLDVWVAERAGARWGEPRPLPAPVSSDAVDMHVTEADDGALYLATRREGSAGRSDLVRVPRTGTGYGTAEFLPTEINDELSQPDALVAPDGSWLIVVVTDHPLGLGGDDLFLARRTSRGWTPLEHLPAPINSEEYEYGPSLSPDGDRIYFTSHRRGGADLFSVPIRALGLDPAR